MSAAGSLRLSCSLPGQPWEGSIKILKFCSPVSSSTSNIFSFDSFKFQSVWFCGKCCLLWMLWAVVGDSSQKGCISKFVDMRSAIRRPSPLANNMLTAGWREISTGNSVASPALSRTPGIGSGQTRLEDFCTPCLYITILHVQAAFSRRAVSAWILPARSGYLYMCLPATKGHGGV